MPSIAGTASNYILNIVELQNVITNVSGTTPMQTLSNTVTNIQKMVNFDQKKILANTIGSYNGSTIQFVNSLNMASNTSITQNGQALTSGAFSTIGNGPSQQGFFSTTTAVPAITMSVGAPTVSPFVVLGNGTLQFPIAGTPVAGRYLTCMDGLGTAEWQDPAPPPSDARLKHDIEPLADSAAILEGLHGVRFKWNVSGNPDVGVIAQDVMRVLPEAVHSTNEYYAVNYVKIIPVLIEAIKGLQARIDVLEKRGL